VVIVGGGIAGLSLACALSDRGRSVALLEARRGVAPPVKRGMSLAPNGLQVLEKLLLLRDLERIGHKVRIVKYLKSSGQLLAAYDYSLLNCKENYLLTFLPHEFEAILRKRAEEKQVTTYEGALFDTFLREDGRVSGLRATIDGKELRLLTSMIVGADGGRSKVREVAGIRAKSNPYKSSYLVTVAGETNGSSEEARHHLAKGRMLGNFPLPHGRYLFFYLPTGSFDELKAGGIERFKADLITLSPEIKESLESKKSWDEFAYMTAQEGRAESWVADHVALIGDAAHSIEPSLGQGGSMALSDVASLVEALEVCFDTSDFSANALKSYEAARRGQTETLQRMAELTAMLMNTNNRAVEWFRDRTLRKMNGNERNAMLALETASGLKQKISLWDKLRLAGCLP